MHIITCFIPAGEVIFGHDEQDMPPDFIFGPADQEFVPATEEIQVCDCIGCMSTCRNGEGLNSCLAMYV